MTQSTTGAAARRVTPTAVRLLAAPRPARPAPYRSEQQ